MNNYAAYQQNQNATQSPREVEYRLLGQVTAALVKAEEVYADSKADVEKKKIVVDAVLWNRNVWSAFRVDLLDAENNLPTELKAQLISISLFIERETTAVLDHEADLEALIDINKQIMDGLKSQVDQTAAAQAPAQPPTQQPSSGISSVDSHA
ncbi:MAG: flagellar biosynthesis regulator FlaF [Alphaproteobacteria bacterium]|nr:flagellar biosynthesis regulator FlaF [Alphaproteobacteria bacterium SS10]